MKNPNKIESTPGSSVGADEERTPVLEYKEIIPEKVDEDNVRRGKCQGCFTKQLTVLTIFQEGRHASALLPHVSYIIRISFKLL